MGLRALGNGADPETGIGGGIDSVSPLKGWEPAGAGDPSLTRAAVERAAIPIFWVTPEGRCGFANDAASRMLGYSREEMESSTISDLDLDFPPKRWPGFWSTLRENPALEFTSVYRSKEGRIFPVEIVASHFEHDGQEFAVASARDISERRDSERALRESQERLKILFEYAPDAYYLSDLGGRFVDANRAAEDLTGFPRHELIGRSFLSLGLIPPEQLPLAARALSLNAMGRPMGPGELTVVRKDGTPVWAEIRTYPLRIQGEVLILGIARDITYRKRAERELRLTQFSLDRAADAVFWIRPDGRFFNVNDAAARSLGYSRGELLGMRVWDIDPKAGNGRWPEIFRDARKARTQTLRGEQRRKDGCLLPVEVAISFMEFEGEECLVAFARDIREQLESERALARSEANFRGIFEEAPHGILRTTPSGQILMANQALATMLGYPSPEDLVSLHMAQDIWLDPGEREELLKAAAGKGEVERVQVQWKRRDGEVITVRISARVMQNEVGEAEFFEDMVEDISEQVRLEEQLRQAQKMEAVGQLTGGIAHDFNNLLSVILLNTDLVRGAVERGIPVPLEDLAEVEEAARKAAAMTKQLLGFSRRASLTRVPTDLGEVVRNLSSLLRRLLPENIHLGVETQAGLPAVEADGGAVEQMILNLSTNSRDAMPGGGALALMVREREVVAADLHRWPWMRPGRYVEICVKDTGTGMEEATLERVFEPFFTTKPVGEGTGLGMAMVYGLTKQHGGYVLVESTRGEGTQVSLLFPVSRGASPLPAFHVREAQPLGGSEVILLVEDEEALRRSGKRVLERFGYTVLLAADGREGLEVYSQRKEEIGLVISDMVMPRLGGAELYRALRDAGEAVPFLMVSGYTGHEATERRVLDPGVPILSKPWDVSELLGRVRQLLD